MDKKLIEFVRSHQCVYDKKHIAYKNKEYKDRLWLQFSKEIKMPVDSLKKRWKCIRDRFCRLYKTKNKETASSSTHKPDTTRLYKYYSSLLFLMDVDSSNDKTTWNPDFEPEEELHQDFETSYSFMDLSGDPTSTTSPEPENKEKSNAMEFELFNTMKTVKEHIERKSSFRVFLESIALSVEEANCSISQISHLQMRILQALQDEMNLN